MDIGKYHTLQILRHTSVGLYLGDEEGTEVLLPNKYCPEEYNLNDEIKVFVYNDYKERLVATNITPKILLHGFALLKVSSTTAVGAFLDWGMEKELLVPFSEQAVKMEEGKSYLVFMDLDSETNRLFATAKLERVIGNEELEVEERQRVDLIVAQKTDLGFKVIVNEIHKGLIYENEIFREINIGDRLVGYVKNIREDHGLDISLQAIGYEKSSDVDIQAIYQELQNNEGFLSLTDKSSPEDIQKRLGISKKAFKKAIGGLYKDRKISIEPDGIRLN